MSPVSEAFLRFDAAYSAMLKAAAEVRAALQAEAGIRGDPCAVIIGIVATHYNFAPAMLQAPERTRDVATARHVAMWLCRQLTGVSLMAIGRAFQRDHGTVLQAIRNVVNRVDTEPVFAAELLELRHRCEKALGSQPSALSSTP